MGGDVFGDQPEAEYLEMERVTKPGALMVLCPGSNDKNSEVHHYLVSGGSIGLVLRNLGMDRSASTGRGLGYGLGGSGSGCRRGGLKVQAKDAIRGSAL